MTASHPGGPWCRWREEKLLPLLPGPLDPPGVGMQVPSSSRRLCCSLWREKWEPVGEASSLSWAGKKDSKLKKSSSKMTWKTNIMKTQRRVYLLPLQFVWPIIQTPLGWIVNWIDFFPPPHCPCSESVTHVVSENNSGEEVRRWLDSQKGSHRSVHLLDIGWFTESMRAGQPVDILDRHGLQVQPFKKVKKKKN